MLILPFSAIQWFSAKGNFATQETLGNVRRHFWLSLFEERVDNGFWWGEPMDTAKHTEMHRTESHNEFQIAPD